MNELKSLLALLLVQDNFRKAFNLTILITDIACEDASVRYATFEKHKNPHPWVWICDFGGTKGPCVGNSSFEI